MPIPQIAPEGSPEEEAAETPEMEGKETKHEIKCMAKDCVHNQDGYCSVDIDVSAGPTPKCNTYESKGGGGSMAGSPMKPPAPPVPFKM